MCGIAGAFCSNRLATPSADLLRDMAESIKHRGPDAEGIWTAPGVGLAHRRLSIIDLADGDQPLGNEDGTVQVVFNGEIYNFRELRRQLESRGHRFRTHSDTEVLVHLYEEYGEELVHRLRGMFAFALYDQKRHRLLLARDRVGLKPLYYARIRDTLVFGSEIKALLKHPGVERDVDIQALEDYLTFGLIPGERTIFRGTRKLAPGHVLTVDAEHFDATPRRYWTLTAEPDDTLSQAQWSEALREKLAETLKLHRIADVPVGAFLSGGIDSSVVVAELSRLMSEPLQTFSIGFHETKFSELPFARQVAQRYQTEHSEEIVTPQAVESLDALIRFYDEPFADASAIPTMYVSRLARQRVKVVLSGDGGDEAFGGYTRYAHDLREAHVRRRIPARVRQQILRRMARHWPQGHWLPRALRAKSTLTNLSLEPPAAYANTLSICRPDLRRSLLQADVLQSLNGHRPETWVEQAYSCRRDPLGSMTTTDIATVLPDDFLTKVDRASMSVGLEVRPPFVDHEFLEMAVRIPSRWKVHRGETKWIFKQLFADRLPREILRRPKQGFEIPVDQWMRGPLRGQIEDVVLAPSSRLARFVDTQATTRLFQSHLRGTGRHGSVLWSLLVLGRWMEEYLPRESQVAITDFGTVTS